MCEYVCTCALICTYIGGSVAAGVGGAGNLCSILFLDLSYGLNVSPSPPNSYTENPMSKMMMVLGGGTFGR